MLDGKKEVLLFILKILLEKSGNDKHLKQKEIIDILNDEYDIKVERKSVAANIDLLIEFFEHQKSTGLLITKSNDGVYVESNHFEECQIQYLLDAVFSSKCLNQNACNDLVNKIQFFLPEYKRVNYQMYKSNRLKTASLTNCLFNADIIMEAIAKNKQVEFAYEGDFVENYKFHVDPYYLINKNGNYYLLGAKGNYENLSEYRLDKMSKIAVREKDRRSLHSLKDVKKDFNINTYIVEHPYEFGGMEVVKAVIKAKDKKALSYIDEWFGNGKSRTQDGNVVRDIKADKKSIILLMLQYYESLELLEPLDLRDEIKVIAESIARKYK